MATSSSGTSWWTAATFSVTDSMMIGHHNGAIDMAQQEVAQGANPDAKALAEKIISDQHP